MSMPSAQKVVLIVDDEEFIRKYIRGILDRSEGASYRRAKRRTEISRRERRLISLSGRGRLAPAALALS